jgi:hypothetical protein
MNSINRIRIHPYFYLREFECRGKGTEACGCNGAVILHADFFNRLVKLREILNLPMNFTRGYSCPGHNHILGGEKHSKHLNGMAVDWDVYSAGLTEYEAANLVYETKLFTGIGIYGKSYRDAKTRDIVLTHGYKNMRGMIHIEYCPDEDSRQGNSVIGPTDLYRKWGDWDK